MGQQPSQQAKQHHPYLVVCANLDQRLFVVLTHCPKSLVVANVTCVAVLVELFLRVHVELQGQAH